MELPAQIGKYKLEEFLGGGMSHVYRARDTVIGRTVAVKILTDEACADPDAKARFLAEARMAGNITHENIINIYDFGEDDRKRPYMVMEFLRGEDLQHAIRNRHTGDLRNRLKIALQVARALAHIHTQRIIHRDIKPDNVHLTSTGAVKLIDFGIAKTEELSLTRTGFVLGTPCYMAPEQVLGEKPTDQVDVYAFGALLYELLSGVKPVTGDNLDRIFYSILNEPVNPEPLHQAGVPEPVCGLITRLTAKDPAKRPQGFSSVLAELEQILQNLEPEVRPVEQAPEIPKSPAPAAPVDSQAEARREPGSAPHLGGGWLLPLAALIGLLIVAGVFLALRHGPKAAISTPTGEMVLVPAGEFLFGEKRESVYLPAFYIDKTEVTKAAYQAFCQATGHALPGELPADSPPVFPVGNVTIADALEFARWAGKRLPTSQEWEKAFRGVDGRLYPWGNQKDPSRANVRDNSTLNVHGPGAANGFSNGASPFGALQMAGNVWELVNDVSTPSPATVESFQRRLSPPPRTGEAWYQIRGGSYDESLTDDVAYNASPIPVRYQNKRIGFRCARDVK